MWQYIFFFKKGYQLYISFFKKEYLNMKLKDAVEIIRPINCVMGSLTVIIGILNTRTGVPLNIFLMLLMP